MDLSPTNNDAAQLTCTIPIRTSKGYNKAAGAGMHCKHRTEQRSPQVKRLARLDFGSKITVFSLTGEVRLGLNLGKSGLMVCVVD